MAFNKTNWVTLTVAFCLAILQALQPFIHTHSDTNYLIESAGFHAGAYHEEELPAHPAQPEHTLHAVPHASHTISVESGIKQDIDLLLAPNIVALLSISLCLAMALHLTTQRYSYFSTSPYQSLRRRLPASRAPPRY